VDVRRVAVLVAAVALTGGGCGTATDEPAGPLPSARFAIPSSTAPSTGASPSQPPSAPDSAAVRTHGDGARVRQAFTRGLAHYCTSYYTLESRTEEEHPPMDPASDLLYARSMARGAAISERLLSTLRPPPDLADTFAQFVQMTHELTTDRMSMAREIAAYGTDGPAGDDFDETVVARRPLAARLDAPICDGSLSRAEADAAVDAVRLVETSPDSARVCSELVTPAFLQYTWAGLADPVQGCIGSRQLLVAAFPDDIDVSEVTGADGITATVHYVLVGGCECPGNYVARLHMVDGTWKVDSISP
jgi:hypothetical protein